MPLEPITRAWILQHAGSVLETHLNMGYRHVMCCRVVDRRDGRAIGLSYTDTSFKRSKRNGERGGTMQRRWYVASHEPPIADLSEALEILAVVRAAEQPDFTNDAPAVAPADASQHQEEPSHA